VEETVAYTSGVVLVDQSFCSISNIYKIEKRFMFVSFSKIRILVWLGSPRIGVCTGFGKRSRVWSTFRGMVDQVRPREEKVKNLRVGRTKNLDGTSKIKSGRWDQ